MTQAAGTCVSFLSNSAPKYCKYVVDDVVNSAEVNMFCVFMASRKQTTGVQERGMVQEKRQELVRPYRFP